MRLRDHHGFQQTGHQAGVFVHSKIGQMKRNCENYFLITVRSWLFGVVSTRVKPLSISTPGMNPVLTFDGTPRLYLVSPACYIGTVLLHRVTQLRVYGVHYRTFTGIVPVVVKVAWLTSAAYSSSRQTHGTLSPTQWRGYIWSTTYMSFHTLTWVIVFSGLLVCFYYQLFSLQYSVSRTMTTTMYAYRVVHIYTVPQQPWG